MSKEEIFIPPYGCINEIAKIVGCSRVTVRTALRKNARGEKADQARQVFRAKYLNTKNH